MGVFTVGRQVALEIDMPGWWLANASVDMDFLNGRYYDSATYPQSASGLLSCTRASIGYAKNVDGTLTQFASNALRIGVGTGLLVEEARTNIVNCSQDFSAGAVWSAQNSSISVDATAAPDGTTTADKIVAAASSATHHSQQNAGAAGTTGSWTVSCYVKAAGYNYAWISNQTSGVNEYQILIDLTTGVIVDARSTGGSPTGVSAGTEVLANGWVRGWVTMDAASANVLVPHVGVFNSATFAAGNIFTGDGVSGIYAWGAQTELGAFVSSYIPTPPPPTFGSATRAADNVATSSTLQSVINAATASLVAQTDNGGIAGVAANIVDSNGTNLLGFDSSNHALASITATLATGNTANRTTQDKSGLAWTASARSIVLNGGTVTTDTSSQTPSATQHIGSSGSANFANAYVERLTAWNTKLANATLQGFTV